MNLDTLNLGAKKNLVGIAYKFEVTSAHEKCQKVVAYHLSESGTRV